MDRRDFLASLIAAAGAKVLDVDPARPGSDRTVLRAQTDVDKCLVEFNSAATPGVPVLGGDAPVTTRSRGTFSLVESRRPEKCHLADDLQVSCRQSIRRKWPEGKTAKYEVGDVHATVTFRTLVGPAEKLRADLESPGKVAVHFRSEGKELCYLFTGLLLVSIGMLAEAEGMLVVSEATFAF